MDSLNGIYHIYTVCIAPNVGLYKQNVCVYNPKYKFSTKMSQNVGVT